LLNNRHNVWQGYKELLMNTLWGLLIAVAIIGTISGFVIWLVGKFKLGLEVNSFGGAFLAAIVIAILAGVVTWLLSLAGVQDGNGAIGGFVHLMISAFILMICGKLLPGLKVDGFVGALVASIAIGAVYWLGGLLLGRLLL
jgi:putative membrane protein